MALVMNTDARTMTLEEKQLLHRLYHTSAHHNPVTGFTDWNIDALEEIKVLWDRYMESVGQMWKERWG